MYYSYGYYDSTYIIGSILVLLSLILVMMAQILVSSSYKKYKKIANKSFISGAEAARRILDANNLSHISIIEVSGNLTDHYDPRTKQVSLSSEIYSGSSIASVAVAAHECGHAIQDSVGYKALRIRSSIVPSVNLFSRLGYIVIFLGLALGLFNLAIFGLILLSATLVFQIITLPVEFNASNRAKKEIDRLNLMTKDEQSGVSKMLMAAAMTYVASVASTLLQMLRLLLIIVSRSSRRD